MVSLMRSCSVESEMQQLACGVVFSQLQVMATFTAKGNLKSLK